MPDATAIRLADAVVAELNDPARAWSQPFTADRQYRVDHKAEDLQTLQVVVVPMTIVSEQANRVKGRYDYGLIIDVQKKVPPSDRAAVDALVNLMEEITDYFADNHELAAAAGWKLDDAQNRQVYSTEQLENEHVFESLIDLTVRGLR